MCDLAARAILTHYHVAGAIPQQAKSDNSPLTAADLESHATLLQGLAGFELPVLSEESPAKWKQFERRREWSAYWLVDPLDGTREFLDRNGEFTINIALVEQGRPSFGMIAIPAAGELYAGGAGLGAWRREEGAWLPINCRSLTPGQPVAVLSSRRHRDPLLQACLDKVAQHPGGMRRDNVGSAVKFCRLAEGVADFYPRFAPCCEWDTAAGQALLEGAGGAVLETSGQPLRYNQRESLLSPHFLAVADPGASLWQQFS
ncbi:MAG: 3'(2'),5'-bisphosphate nucleotidase CysQ [Halieaceae bacterium]